MELLKQITGMSHTGYVVEDVEAVLAQFQRTFECCLDVKTYYFSPTRAWCGATELKGLQLKIAMCKVSDAMAYEFIQPVTQAGYHFAALVADGNHLNHIALQTETYDTLYQSFLEAKGVILFEAETNDQLIGYRRCCYARLPGLPGVFEVTEKPTPYRPNEQ